MRPAPEPMSSSQPEVSVPIEIIQHVERHVKQPEQAKRHIPIRSAFGW